MLCLSACLSVCQSPCTCVDYVPIHASLNQTLPTIWAPVLSCVLAELWSSVTQHLHISLQEGCYPSRYPIVATSLTAAVMVNKHQAPLVLCRYCWRALGVQKTDDTQMLPTSAGARQAPTVRAGVDSAAAADLWLFVTHGRVAPSPLPPSLPPFSSLS